MHTGEDGGVSQAAAVVAVGVGTRQPGAREAALSMFDPSSWMHELCHFWYGERSVGDQIVGKTPDSLWACCVCYSEPVEGTGEGQRPGNQWSRAWLGDLSAVLWGRPTNCELRHWEGAARAWGGESPASSFEEETPVLSEGPEP